MSLKMRFIEICGICLFFKIPEWFASKIHWINVVGAKKLVDFEVNCFIRWTNFSNSYNFSDYVYTTLLHGIEPKYDDFITDKVFNRPNDLPLNIQIPREIRYSLTFGWYSKVCFKIKKNSLNPQFLVRQAILETLCLFFCTIEKRTVYCE